MTYDLEYFPNYCAFSGGVFEGRTFKSHFRRFMEVRGATEPGWAFVDAYWEATDRKHATDIVMEDDGSEYPESLEIALEDFDRFKRQARLAGVTMTERKKHWDDEAA
jgi:hypothetical protein